LVLETCNQGPDSQSIIFREADPPVCGIDGQGGLA
jgi:hypothetical protein